ncbi:MAG: ATP-binding cassette domain-containing protein, partial [Desulfomonilaceae bacterium]
MGDTLQTQGSDMLLSVRDVSKSFGGVRAVVAVSFDLYKGELLGIIGPNGSGKTTLVNLITGFLGPDSGTIEYQGRNITGWMPYRIARL